MPLILIFDERGLVRVRVGGSSAYVAPAPLPSSQMPPAAPVPLLSQPSTRQEPPIWVPGLASSHESHSKPAARARDVTGPTKPLHVSVRPLRRAAYKLYPIHGPLRPVMRDRWPAGHDQQADIGNGAISPGAARVGWIVIPVTAPSFEKLTTNLDGSLALN